MRTALLIAVGFFVIVIAVLVIALCAFSALMVESFTSGGSGHEKLCSKRNREREID